MGWPERSQHPSRPRSPSLNSILIGAATLYLDPSAEPFGPPGYTEEEEDLEFCPPRLVCEGEDLGDEDEDYYNPVDADDALKMPPSL